MDVGKLPNHVNIVLCVRLFSLTCVFSICFVSHRLEFWLKFPTTRNAITRSLLFFQFSMKNSPDNSQKIMLTDNTIIFFRFIAFRRTGKANAAPQNATALETLPNSPYSFGPILSTSFTPAKMGANCTAREHARDHLNRFFFKISMLDDAPSYNTYIIN